MAFRASREERPGSLTREVELRQDVVVTVDEWNRLRPHRRATLKVHAREPGFPPRPPTSDPISERTTGVPRVRAKTVATTGSLGSPGDELAQAFSGPGRDRLGPRRGRAARAGRRGRRQTTGLRASGRAPGDGEACVPRTRRPLWAHPAALRYEPHRPDRRRPGRHS